MVCSDTHRVSPEHSLRAIALEFESDYADHPHVVSEDRDSIQPDLIERVDSLLEQIEETSKSYVPKEERGLDSGALISDEGTIAPVQPQDTTDTEDSTENDEAQDTTDAAAESETQTEDQIQAEVNTETDAEAESKADPLTESESPSTDSIETAQQALEAIEEIEQQAEDLVGESIDGLLESTESAAEITAEPEAVSEPAPINETDEIDTTLIDELDLDIDEIESALESSTIPESARADSSDDDSAAPAETASTDAPESTAQPNEDDGLVDAIDALLDAEPIENQTESADEVDGVDEIVDSMEESLQSLPETEPDPAAETELDAEFDTGPEIEPETAPDEPTDTAPDTTPEADIEEQEEPQAEVDADEVSLEEIEASLTVEHESPTSGSLDDSMDLLDSALAMAADDMLDGDFETEEGELVSGEAVASAIETALQESEESPQQEPADSVSEDDSIESSIDDAVGDLLDSADIPIAADEVQEADEEADAPAEVTTQDATETVEQAAAEVDPVAEPAPEPSAQQAVDDESELSDETTPEAQSESEADDETEPQTAEPDSEVLEEIEALEQIEAAQPVSVPAWFERCVEVVRPWVDKYDPLKGKTMDAVAAVLGTALVLIITHATPIGAKAVLIVSKPLSKQSPEIRNAVGYIALWTGFLAMVVWVYLLMFRAPHIPQPDTAPSRVIDVTEPMDPDPDPASVLPES